MVGKGGAVDGSRTVECLRGRLLAERLASKAAREEAELLGKRLEELERLLAMEIKASNNAEKRLRGIMKKLVSLKIILVSRQSNVSETSGSSSSTGFPTIQQLEEGRTRSQSEESEQFGADKKDEGTRNLLTWEHFGDESSDVVSPGSINRSLSHEESWVSMATFHFHINEDPGREEAMDIRESLKYIGNGEQRVETMSEEAACGRDAGDVLHKINDVDDGLALVPAGLWDGVEASCKRQSSSNVEGALDALRHVKAQLQDLLMGRRIALASKELYDR